MTFVLKPFFLKQFSYFASFSMLEWETSVSVFSLLLLHDKVEYQSSPPSTRKECFNFVFYFLLFIFTGLRIANIIWKRWTGPWKKSKQ